MYLKDERELSAKKGSYEILCYEISNFQHRYERFDKSENFYLVKGKNTSIIVQYFCRIRFAKSYLWWHERNLLPHPFNDLCDIIILLGPWNNQISPYHEEKPQSFKIIALTPSQLLQNSVNVYLFKIFSSNVVKLVNSASVVNKWFHVPLISPSKILVLLEIAFL